MKDIRNDVMKIIKELLENADTTNLSDASKDKILEALARLFKAVEKDKKENK